MDGLKFMDWNDPLNRWSVDRVLDIVTKVKKYTDKHGIKNAELLSVEDSSYASSLYPDNNDRVDIEIRYLNECNQLIMQKLFIMKGELIDGTEFHKRRREFYPEKGKAV